MGWKDLLQTGDETIVTPWVGGRLIRHQDRMWTIDGKLPREHGWYRFELKNRSARMKEQCDPDTEVLILGQSGYLAGDRFIADDARVDPDPGKLVGQSEQVFLIEDGLERFTRVRVGRTGEYRPLIFVQQEMPLGPETDVLFAFQDGKKSVSDIKGVSPALDAAFRLDAYQREEARKRREEAERRRQEEEAQRALEERRKELYGKLGDGASRREMAKVDFGEAARAALAVGGAEYLDHRKGHHGNEAVVTFRYINRRFECVADTATLQIIDSGICLIDHDTDERGDTYFTLESLPGVISEAHAQGALVVFRHARGG